MYIQCSVVLAVQCCSYSQFCTYSALFFIQCRVVLTVGWQVQYVAHGRNMQLIVSDYLLILLLSYTCPLLLVQISQTLFPVDHPPCDEWINLRVNCNELDQLTDPCQCSSPLGWLHPAHAWRPTEQEQPFKHQGSVLQTSNYTSQDSMF